MADSGDADAESCVMNQEYIEPTLETLPRELLLHICSFLEAKHVIRQLGAVCRYFHSIINDNFFWKARIGKRLQKKYPAIPVVDSEFNWQEACIDIEEKYRQWRNGAAEMDYFKYNHGLFAGCDSVHLMKHGRILATGSRDRYLNLVDVQKLDPQNPTAFTDAKILTKMDAHKGWIWTMDSCNDILATGSWDTKIKFWDVNAGGVEQSVRSAKSALLCLKYEPTCVLAGSYDKKVYQFDPRAQDSVETKKYHSRPVLCLDANDRYIVTGSEDKKLVIYDRRAAAIYKTLQFAEFPLSVCYAQDQLWVGDKLGLIHLIDATDGDFNVVETYDVGHKGNVTGIIQTPGALFTCCTDKTVKVMEPCLSVNNPTVISTLAPHTAPMACISYQNGVLAAASSDCSVGIWRPKTHDTIPHDTIPQATEENEENDP